MKKEFGVISGLKREKERKALRAVEQQEILNEKIKEQSNFL